MDNEDQNQPEKSPLFSENSQALVKRDAAAVARATQEIQASLVIAQRFPRDEIKAKARILQACKRKGLAEMAEYEYSRGGTRITGATIDLLRAIANRWGNLLFGWDEVEREDGQSRVRCWAWDTQSNSRAERTFQVKHWRDTQGGGYALKDERDIYEAIANVAARRVRACLEEVIDADVVDAAIDQCRATMKHGETVPLADRAVQMVNAFAEFGVTKSMIETRLGNNLDSVSENQLASLRRIYRSLKDGVGKREDYFKPQAEQPNFAGAGTGTTTAPGQAETVIPPSGSSGEAATGAATAPATPPPTTAPPAPESENVIKLIRSACKSAKIGEGPLLGHLAAIGVTDGSAATLEELQLQHPTVLAKVMEQWANIREAIQAKKKE